jgi:hypothetical protein
MDNIRQSPSAVERIAGKVSSNPVGVEEWRDSAQEAIRETAKDDTLPLQKRIEQTAGMRESNFGAFRNTLRAMHQISLKLFAPPEVRDTFEKFRADFYVLVKENGIISVASEDEVLKHVDIPLTSM